MPNNYNFVIELPSTLIMLNNDMRSLQSLPSKNCIDHISVIFPKASEKHTWHGSNFPAECLLTRKPVQMPAGTLGCCGSSRKALGLLHYSQTSSPRIMVPGNIPVPIAVMLTLLARYFNKLSGIQKRVQELKNKAAVTQLLLILIHWNPTGSDCIGNPGTYGIEM